MTEAELLRKIHDAFGSEYVVLSQDGFDRIHPPPIDSGLGVTVWVGPSAGADGAILVLIDTEFEPDASDGGPGLRVLINDDDAFIGVPYQAVSDRPVCDYPGCPKPQTHCHGGEIYLCDDHYAEAAEAVAHGIEVEAWLARVDTLHAFNWRSNLPLPPQEEPQG